MSEKTVYRIAFYQKGKVYELYARSVTQGGLLGFILVEGILFGERTKLVLDSSEEALRTEFEGVKRFWVPIHSVARIDEVEKAGSGRISDGEGKVTPFPVHIFGQREGR